MDQKPSDFAKDAIRENGLHSEISLTAESEIKTFEAQEMSRQRMFNSSLKKMKPDKQRSTVAC
jgi:hypothetical protein